jgi:hypothetical protein
MNGRNKQTTSDKIIDIFASCNGVMGDAARQLVTKSVNELLPSLITKGSPGSYYLPKTFKGPINFS